MEIAIIGAPVDLGADRRGVDMGPSAIRYAGLEVALKRLGYAVTDTGNVASPVAEAIDTGTTKLKYLEPIVRMCESLADVVSDAIDAGQFPLVLGGDHSLSLGSVAGVARRRSVGIVWIDAHGDFNTDRTSPSGNIHGMVLAALAGYGDARLTGSAESRRRHGRRTLRSSGSGTSTQESDNCCSKPASTRSPCTRSTVRACRRSWSR